MPTNSSDGTTDGPEYLGSGPAHDGASSVRSGPRRGVIGAAAVGVVAVVALGGWGALNLLAGGEQPADVIPAGAVGYLSVDVDPSASQKIEAVRMLKKFPGVEKELDISDRGDLRRWIFTQMQEDGVCKGLDYAEDVEPWIGDRFGVAVMPMEKGADEPPFLVAVQVTDEEAAARGVEALRACDDASEDESGYTFLDDYVLISQSEKQAKELAADAEEASLADDSEYQAWGDRVGDPGFINLYASAGAANLIADALDSGAFDDAGSGMDGEVTAGKDTLSEQYRTMFKDFEGMAGAIRFDDGTVEAEFAGKGMPSGVTPATAGSAGSISELPASTGAALSISLTDGWSEEYLESMSGMFGAGETSTVEDFLVEMERATGLSLPEDVETLLGENVTASVDAGLDIDALVRAQDPTQLPVGVKVQGDPDEILPVVEKIRTKLGPQADMLVVEPGEGVVAFGVSPDYVQTLLEGGDLGDEEAFQKVVPDVDGANSVFFVNFDAGDGWADSMAKRAGDSKLTDNVAPLDAFGASSWVDDDDIERGVLRLTTD